ncbi:uncharacterized protein [Penaeus vannamei]|uniref:uncharacterized protein n=1 Tax=Penaeus vannamei TaxID=6689 RepID=UPI00387F9E07
MDAKNIPDPGKSPGKAQQMDYETLNNRRRKNSGSDTETNPPSNTGTKKPELHTVSTNRKQHRTQESNIQTQWEGLKKQGGKPEGFLSEVRTARDDANRKNNRAVSNVADMKIWYMFVIMKMLQTLHDLEFVRLCACVHRECGFVSTLSMVSSLGLCYDAGPFRHTTFTI